MKVPGTSRCRVGPCPLFNDSRPVRAGTELPNREALVCTIRQPFDDGALDGRVRSTPTRRSSRTLPE